MPGASRGPPCPRLASETSLLTRRPSAAASPLLTRRTSVLLYRKSSLKGGGWRRSRGCHRTSSGHCTARSAGCAVHCRDSQNNNQMRKLVWIRRVLYYLLYIYSRSSPSKLYLELNLSSYSFVFFLFFVQLFSSSATACHDKYSSRETTKSITAAAKNQCQEPHG